MKVCPRQAISIYKGIRAMVDPNQCVGCGLCKKECPANAIVIEEKVYEETLVRLFMDRQSNLFNVRFLQYYICMDRPDLFLFTSTFCDL